MDQELRTVSWVVRAISDGLGVGAIMRALLLRASLMLICVNNDISTHNNGKARTPQAPNTSTSNLGTLEGTYGSNEIKNVPTYSSSLV